MSGAIGSLLSAYGSAAERMQELPLYNERLAVEAVGFRQWQERTIGVLVTPWFMNLMLLPGDADDWNEYPVGSITEWKLPSGTYEFRTCRLAEAGTHLGLTLFTTLEHVPDQDTARALAEEVLARLFDPAGPEHASNQPYAAPVTRRDLLQGRVAGRPSGE